MLQMYYRESDKFGGINLECKDVWISEEKFGRNELNEVIVVGRDEVQLSVKEC